MDIANDGATGAKIKFTRKEWILLLVLASIQFSHIVDFVIMMPLGPALKRAFQTDPHQFGLLVSSYTFAAGISGLLASFFVDRFDRRNALIFFATGFSLGTLACGFAPTYELLLVSRSLAGFFGGVLGSLVMAIISDAFAYERRGSAMGIQMGSFSLATIIGVPLGLRLVTMGDWHTPFRVLGALSAAVTLCAAFLVPSMRGHMKTEKHSRLDSFRHILATPNQQWALLFMFFLMMGQFTIIPFISPSYVANVGMAESDLPLVYLFGGLCSIVASPLAGRLSDRIGKPKVFIASAVLSLIPIMLTTTLGASPLWIPLAVSCLLFVAMSGRMVPAMAMVSATASPAYRGSFMSISASVQQFGAAAASYVAGLIITEGDGGRLLHYEVVGYIAVAFSLACVPLALRLRVTKGQERELV